LTKKEKCLFCINIFSARVPTWNIYREIKSTGKISNDFANEYHSSGALKKLLLLLLLLLLQSGRN